MRAVVFTLGCKCNEVESASIMAELERCGWEVSDKLSPADIYVLNTCAVTREAERKSRQLISRVRRFNAQAPVYVCGCASEKNREQFERDGVAFIGGAKNKAEIIAAIARDYSLENCPASLGYPKQVRTRAFIKIQDGCNNFCSYCIIPYLRGRIRSRTVADVVEEVRATNSLEVVFTGINISVFGQDTGESLTGLLTALKDCDKRIRLGSLECGVIDDKFLQACKNLSDFAPQFHLSLQSGSDNVLKAMNRRYTRAQYLEKCKLIYSYFPDAAITTDIIAGFCGETEEDFRDSLSIIGEARLSRVHAFAFSPREGTRAYSLPDIPAPIKARRLHELLNEGAKAEERYLLKQLSSLQSVVFEEFDGEYTTGYTAGYIKVYCAGEREGKKTVKLIGAFRDGALAEVTDND
ncbi:MAG: MiaB/RimO family radical SAM methylthiotransferase [Candidatus Coproplasma sp.]